jgi:fatty-acyl-CoA synthase
MFDALRREWRFHSGLARTLLRVRSIRAGSANLVTDDLERAVDRWRNHRAIVFEGRALSYGHFDALANRYAHWALAQGLKRGEAVAVVLPNRLEYVPLWFGLTKVGVVAALINNQLAGEALAHCLRLSQATVVIVDDSTAAATRAAAPPGMVAWDLGGDLAEAITGLDASRPPRSLRAGMTAADTALYIYTSGTTGLPKAARVAHMRAQLYMRGFAGATGAGPHDRLYVTLPLYHATGGLCAIGAALLNGGSVILRPGFSAGHFWDDVAAEGATMFVYIGELVRYLANHPPTDNERRHRLRLAFGNGLARDMWQELVGRFAVPRILEFYGSTEGNVSLFNFDGGVGAVGRVPPWLAGAFNVAVARFDVAAEAEARGPDGRCIACAPGEIGECLGAIRGGARTAYSGYVDPAASEKKVLRGAFRHGDAWFRTGDLMRRDRLGYLYFVDRVGDTFRWKGENVSTREVADAIMAAPGVREAIVYGVAVPHHEGRAGMSAVVTGPGFDLAVLSDRLAQALPAYAAPLFLRLTQALDVTGTFKPRKLDLVADGFDPARIGAPLFIHDRDTGYIPLTAERFAAVANGTLRI